VQRFLVDGLCSLVGTRQARTSIVDLLLREVFDDQEVSYRVARFDKLAVRSDDFSSFDHVLNLLRIGAGSRKSEAIPGTLGFSMNVKCEIDGCSNNAQAKMTTSGYEFCSGHYKEWADNNMFVVEEDGKVLLKGSSA
jgi:hypothetical protein